MAAGAVGRAIREGDERVLIQDVRRVGLGWDPASGDKAVWCRREVARVAMEYTWRDIDLGPGRYVSGL